MKIDRLTARDWQRGKAIRLRALQQTPDAFGSTFEDESKYTDADWVARLERPDAATFIAVSAEGCDIGLAVGAPYESDAGLFSMWVDPTVRKQGAGVALIKAIIDWARQQGYSAIRLDVADHNLPAVALYEKNGFTANGITGSLPPPREHIKEHQRVLMLSSPASR